MKKIITAIPIATMFIIFVFLLVYMCLPEKPSDVDKVFTFSLYFLRTRLLYCAVLGGILMTAFYHLTLYIFRRREITYLYFTIWCLLCVTVFVFVPNGLNDVFGWIPQGEFLTKFSYVALFLYHNMITVVGMRVFSRSFLQKYKKALVLYITAGTAYLCLVPVSVSFYSPVFFLFIFVVSMFITAVAFRSRVLRENKWTWLFFISFIFFIAVTFLNNIILSGLLFLPGLTAGLFLILAQSVLLSKNYTDAFRLVEETNENLERTVDERTKDLQNTNTAMKELVGNISHDLKTPLAVMSVNLEELSNLSQTLADEDYARCVRIAYQKNLDLQRLIQNLMEISRIETEQSLLRPDWVSLSELFSKAQDKYDDYLNGKGVFFEITYTGNAEIYTDPQRIWSVFDNAVYNAARYTGAGGVITINADVLDKKVVITITDTGFGIVPEHLPHIFERFYKADPSRSANDGDSGLGLYIVKSIMEATGGTVTAASEPGKGTSIILSFIKKTD